MKKYSLAFKPKKNLLSTYSSRCSTFFILIFFLIACTNDLKQAEEQKQKPPEGFVYLENDSFKVADSNFFPSLMNYIIHPRLIDSKIVWSPSLEYDNPETFDGDSKVQIKERFRAHFKAIKLMGFNTLRLVGLNHLKVNDQNLTTYIEVFTELNRTAATLNTKTINELVEALKEVLDVAKEEGLKVMILLPKPMKNLNYTHQKDKYVIKILETFSSENTIFSYDFFNEPIYFDNVEQKRSEDVLREKSSAYLLALKWKEQMQQYAPNQLFTISFAEPIEVFEWDPSILPIDFVSIHTYHPLRVPNEIYWFSKYINKPWMITETSLPADNDSISYKDQAIFMQEAFQRTVNCGGIGFGWWQYQDVSWGPFEHNYTPLINSNYQSKTELDSNNWIFGQFKEAAFVLPKLKREKTANCDCHVNYFNMMGFSNYKIEGKVVNASGEPIEGAVIRGWNEYWTIGMNTFTNEQGIFNLYSNDENLHFEISAPGYSRIKYFSKKLDYVPKPSTIGLENVKLEYHSNHFQWYLDSAFVGKSVFKFKEDIWSNYKTQASIGTIELEKLEL